MIETILLAAADSTAAVVSKSEAFSTLDLILFCVAVVGVIALGIWKSRDESSGKENDDKGDKSASDYFLAGRGLTWWLVGFSLIAANISTEQFVGMSGQAADWLGMAIASYEWMAAITLVIVAFCFLPKLLRGGVYTIPEFLEYRYNTLARACMAGATLLVLVGVPTATVIYSGAKVISVFFAGYTLGPLDFGDITLGCVIIALSGAVYVYVGGLKACAWTDLIWGAALIVGGGVVAYLAMSYLGQADANHLWDSRSATSSATVADIQNASAFERFHMLNSGPAVEGANGVGGKFHMIRPASDAAIPWTALLLGLWIPNFFYWGLNQYIMQRTLGSKSLSEGQLGIVFAAFLKLIIPFVVVIPGILAYNLFSGDLRSQAISKNDEGGLQMVVDPAAYRSAQEAKGTKAADIEASIAKAGKTLYPVTDGFVAVDTAKAKAVVLHNLKLAAPLLPAADEMKTTLMEGFVKVEQDAANTDTNRSQRLILAQDITKINEKILGAVKSAKGGEAELLSVGRKMVGYDYDAAFPTLLNKLLKPGLSWFVLAALFGAVVSSLASMLNSASTIFTMDMYHKFRKDAPASELVQVGKWGVIGCVLIALVIAPQLGNPKFGGIFTFVQEFQGFISPGALCVFLFGFFVPKCPRFFGWFGIVLNVVLYSILYMFFDSIPFLNRMAICFGVITALGLIFTWINVMRGGEAISLPVNNKVDISTSPKAKVLGIGVIIATIVLYVIFW